MKKGIKAVFIVVAMGAILVILATNELYYTYKRARAISASQVAHLDDCIYVGARLSFSQIFKPPPLFPFPHWEMTYKSPDFTRNVSFSEIYGRLNLTLHAAAPININFVRVGYIKPPIFQHPIMTSPISKWDQVYFTTVKDGEITGGEMILLVPKGQPRPEQGRLLEITGSKEDIDLGGPPGTKSSYKNKLIYVSKWKYVEPDRK